MSASGGEGRHVERLGVVPVHPVAGPPEADEVVALHPIHRATARRGRVPHSDTLCRMRNYDAV